MLIFEFTKCNYMGAFFKKNYVHFVAIGIFLLISSIFFSPALKGFIPKMHDITTHRSSSKEIVDFKNVYGEDSYWTSRVFSGMPSYQILADYPKGVQRLIFKIATVWLPYPINVLFLLFVSLYILLMCLKVDPWIAIVGAVGFGLCSHFIIIMGAGHTSKTHAMAYIPAILGAFIRVLKGSKYIRYGILLAVLLMLQLFANHYQVTYYTFILLLITGLFVFPDVILKDIKRYRNKNKDPEFENYPKPWSSFLLKPAIIVIAGLLAFGANSSSILMTSDFAKHTIRGKSELTVSPDGKEIDKTELNQTDGLDRSYITEYTYDKGELFSYLVPNSIEAPEYSDFLQDMARRNPQEYQALVDAYQANSGKLSRNRGVFLSGYFGDQTSARPHYLGALFIFLAILGLFFAKGWIKWGLFAATFLAILLSLGQNLGGSMEDMWLTNWFIDNVPLYNKFRAVKMILVLAEVSIPVLAMLGLHQILKDREVAAGKKKLFFGVSGVFFLFMIANAFNPELIASFYSTNEMAVMEGYGSDLFLTNATESATFESAAEKVKDFRIEGYGADMTRALIFVILGIAVLSLYFLNVIKRNVVIPVLSFILFIDMFSMANRFSSNEMKGGDYVSWQPTDDLNKRAVALSPADRQILEIEQAKIPDFVTRNRDVQKKLKEAGFVQNAMDKQIAQYTTLNFNTNYRVLGLTNPFNDGETPFYHKSTTGYNAAKLKKFQEIIEFRLGSELQQLQDPTVTKVVNMLNTRYIIAQDKSQAFTNPFAFGNAWFAKGFHKVENANEEILAINEVDVKELAIVQEKYLDQINLDIGVDEGASIIQRTLDYRPNHLVYDFKSTADQFVVFSEIYYPDGWNAYIDGALVDHIGVNYILRGLSVPSGEHKIEFKFEPTKVANLNTIGLICSTIVLLLVLVWVFILYKERKKPLEAK